MPKTRLQKIDTVSLLSDKLGRSKSVVFADYKGLTMNQLDSLRNQLRDQSAQFLITKNNLLKLSLKDSKMTVSDKVLEGPTATLFSFDDEISPIKSLTKALKEF